MSDMRKIIYPRFSKYDWVFLRSQGAGLGNLLFPYARAVLYSQASDTELLMPTWRNIKLGPYIRREPDKRTYGELFRHRTLQDIAKIAKARFLKTTKTVSEEDFLAGNLPNAASSLVIVSGQKNNFQPLMGYEDILREAFLSMLRVPPPQHHGEIAIHVRMGDFSAATTDYARNSRLPLDWYIEEIERVRVETGLKSVSVFTDDGTGEAAAFFAGIDNTSVVSPINAATDMIHMSNHKHIVCSNSTFSLWGAFLSKGSFSTRSPELFIDYGFNQSHLARRL